jgi:hypothetical protein
MTAEAAFAAMLSPRRDRGGDSGGVRSESSAS